MNTRELLIDLFDDNLSRFTWLLDNISDDCFHWQPDEGANSIAHTIWHCGRVFDVFYTQFALGKTAVDEQWAQNGWSQKTGYDPYGIGSSGWGTIQGYTAEEVAAIPKMSKEHVLAYLKEICELIKGDLSEMSAEALEAMAPGFEGKYSVYFWIRTPLMDLTRHLGESLAIKEVWDRKYS
ncbi:MAG: DinB family protein [Chloroflexota bacterium]